MEINFPKLEEKILKLWRDSRVFEKSVKQRAGARNFVFYEGPPTANGRPGIHHVLARVFKDVICRYKTMQGFRVLRKAGWDTHGLPVEIEVEKKLGLKSKKDIEKYGIAEFNKKCKESVWTYKDEWEKLTERIGYWLDMKNPYITYDADYIETLWFIIKKIWQKGLLYQDYKVLPYCPRCGTPVSSHEVALGYKSVKDNSIYVRFKAKSQDPAWKNTSILAWTTTPWTLPGNVALAVNQKLKYICIPDHELGEGYWLVLGLENFKNLLKKGVFSGEYKDIDIFDGKEMIGIRYQPLFKSDKNPSYNIIPADFVSSEDGTGIVHIAPAFGEEDLAATKARGQDFPVLVTVDGEGKMQTPGYGWDKKFIKDADPLIIDDLKARGLLFKEEEYEHDYPFCWRCESPLLYYAKKSWFIRMTKVKKELLLNNQKINWIPKHLKEGRFGEWLKEVKDWAFSRERYWGTPLPVWQCKKCGKFEVIGSRKDLASQKFTTNQFFVLRHGEALTNKRKISSCWPEKHRFPLSKAGESQIKKIAGKFKGKIDLIFSSDLLRTKQSAEIISKVTGVSVKYDARLRELDIGSLNSKSVEEIGRFWDPEKKLSKTDYFLRRFEVKAPGGESWTDLKDRTYRFIQNINEKYDGKRILIISHEAPITMLEGAAAGFSFREIVRHRLKKRIKVGELRELDFKIWPYNEDGKVDFHRPYIDEVEFYCGHCKNIMKRAPDLIDVWFDSGSMPFAQNHWLGGRPPKLFPANYISEAIDQTRGWFYTLLAISTLLGFGASYRNVISLGHVLDEKGEKMSKSKGNTVDPWYMVEKYGADAVRWYFYTVNSPGDPKLFSEKDVDQSLKKFILILWNSFVFFQTYALHFQRPSKIYHRHILDRWITSELNELILGVSQKLDDYDITGAARAIENFVIGDFSQWYIRRSRRRFQKPKTEKELKEASATLGFVLLALSKICAPFAPFISEEIYRNLIKKQSVHLESWPKIDRKSIDDGLSQKMNLVREIVSLGLDARVKAGVKVRQPLAAAKIKSASWRTKIKNNKELVELIKEELNVKEVVFDSKINNAVELDTRITPELKEEGIIREVIRRVQEMRKEAGLKPKHGITIQYSGDEEFNNILAINKNVILKETMAKNLVLKPKPKQVFSVEKEVKVDNKNLWLGIKKL